MKITLGAFFLSLMLCLPVNAATIRLTNQKDTVPFQQAVEYINNKVGEPLLTITTSTPDILVSGVTGFKEGDVVITEGVRGRADVYATPKTVEYLQTLPTRIKFLTFIHEITHALKIPHSFDKSSIMFWDYSRAGDDLTEDDVELIKFMNRKELGYMLLKVLDAE